MAFTAAARSAASWVRSTITRSEPGPSRASRGKSGASTATCPAARSMPMTFEPKRRSGTYATTRAIGPLLAQEPPAGLAERLGSAPLRLGGRAADPRLAHGDLAGDPRLVEDLQRRVRRGRRGGVPESVGDDDPEVPVVLRVRLGVAGDHVD